MPAALATELLLGGAHNGRGVTRPFAADIYNPLLNSLEKNGIFFKETSHKI